jgi:hypothetical protein
MASLIAQGDPAPAGDAQNELLWIERNHRHGSPLAGRRKAGVMAEPRKNGNKYISY